MDGRTDGTMTHLDALDRVAETAGRLQRVTAHHFDGDPRLIPHIVLEFEATRLFLSATDEDDSIVVSTEAPSMPGCVPRAAAAWAPAVGRAVLWGWILTNHRGYVDGVRFAFRNTVSDSGLIIEVVVAASMLHTVVVGDAT